MQALEFLRHPTGPGRRPIYAVSGDDAYLRREALAAIVRVVLGDDPDEMAVSRFAGESAGLADVLDEVRTLPFLSKARVAIVENADPFVTAHRKELELYADRPAETGVLVLSVKSWPGNTNLAKKVDRVGLGIDCRSPSERELPAWVIGLAKGQGLKLENDAANLLVELVGPEVGLLAAEVEKLATYVGDRKTIRREDVAKMVGAGRVEEIWAALDAATTGKPAEALKDLDRLLTAGEAPVALLAAIGRSLLRVHHAGRLRRAGMPPKDACRVAGIPPFASESALRQHAHLGPSRVDRLPEMLLKADLDLKGNSQLAPRVVLETLFLELARPRRD